MTGLVQKGARRNAILLPTALVILPLAVFGFSSEVDGALLQDPADGTATQGAPSAKAEAGAASVKDSHEFELRVVGPGAKPIPDAVVEITTKPLPTADQVRKGKFAGKKSYVARLITDSDGRLVLTVPPDPPFFSVYITIPGFGPYWAGWSSESHRETIPAVFTAELEPAWSIGGIVVDTDGKPIEGAEIGPHIEFKKRPGESQQLASGATVKSGAKGKWRFDSVPVSLPEVSVHIDHPNYQPQSRVLSRREFGIEMSGDPSAKITLSRGLTVTGKITDEAGQPIAGALIRAQAWNGAREAKTDPNGKYKLVGCDARPTRIVVSARGRAIDKREIKIEPAMGPVDFQLKPGGTVRVRVLDQRGNPVPKARIFFQRWRGEHAYFEFGHVNQYADANGIWVWNEAPPDEFQADICPPDGMELQLQPLVARAEEYVFRVPDPLVVTGQVVDAVTRKPIKKFQVVPGGRYGDGSTFWSRTEAFAAVDGRFEYRSTRGSPTNLIRIEADRYQVAVSRDIRSDEGKIALDFGLKQGHDVAAKVVTPRNLPAAGAKVALGIAGSQIMLSNGDFDDSMTSCARAETDEAGRFHFPAQDKEFQLVITHPTGFARIASTADWELMRIIHLQPWCRVEGTFRIGKSPAANIPMGIDFIDTDGFRPDAPRIFAQQRASTATDGRFVFERVIPRNGQIGRRITYMANSGATEVTSAQTIRAEFPEGKTVRIDFGGTGRAVVGRLQAPEGLREKVRWSFASITVLADGPQAAEATSQFAASVGTDGGFQIDDVPPGEYSLRVDFMRPGQPHLQNHHFKVPPGDGPVATQPVDLGLLKLVKP